MPTRIGTGECTCVCDVCMRGVYQAIKLPTAHNTPIYLFKPDNTHANEE